jgi:hypothetical protein
MASGRVDSIVRSLQEADIFLRRELTEKLYIWSNTSTSIPLCVRGNIDLLCVEFVNPGFKLPPLVDPQSFLEFVEAHVDGGRPHDWQARETAGDRFHDRILAAILLDWGVTGALYPILINAFRSNAYGARLAEEHGLVDLCIRVDSTTTGSHYRGKSRADIWEVTRPSPPQSSRD